MKLERLRLLNWTLALVLVAACLAGGWNSTYAQAAPAAEMDEEEQDNEPEGITEPAQPTEPRPKPAAPVQVPRPGQPVQPNVAQQQPVLPTPKGPAVVNTPPPKNGEKKTLETVEFQNAPVNAVLDYYARLTNRSIIAPPTLAGVINFRSQTHLTIEEAIQALDTVLAINNIGVVPMGEKFLKVVQITTAKQEGIPVAIADDRAMPPADTLMTQIVPLKFADATEATAAIQPYLHAYGQILPLAKSNSILITDTGANINQMLEIIKYVDQPSAMRLETKIYIMKFAKAADVVQRLQSIIQETQQLQTRPGGITQPPVPVPQPPSVRTTRTTSRTGPVGEPAEDEIIEGKVIITSDDRTNKIFVLTRATNFEFFDKMIEELDSKVDPDVITKVFALEYANSEDVAGMLNSLITGAAMPTPTSRRTQTGTTTRTGTSVVPPPPTPMVSGLSRSGTEMDTGFLQFAEGVRILPDPRTNSLLIMATREDMIQIEALVKSVDTAVAQVLIEVVIAEVNLSGSLEAGVETVKRMFQSGQVKQTGSTVASPGKVPPVDLGSLGGELLGGLSTNAVPLALASSSGGLTYFLTFQNLKLDAVVRLLATSSKVKVLSTPIIQTLHNQEASIIVGESRPFPTSTVSDIVATGTTAVRSSVEFKDIAIELVVTPRINPDGYVTMDIEQKINDVGENVSIGDLVVASITKREAKSAVTVKSEATIVLGGLIKERKTQTETKVPFFGDIPFFGALFRNKGTDKQRTELIVFIRPSVLRTPADAENLVERRIRDLKSADELELMERFKRSGTPPPDTNPETKASSPPAATFRTSPKVAKPTNAAATPSQP